MKLREVAVDYRAIPVPIEQSKVINIRDLKAHASEILRDMERTGESALITRRGTPWARLVPLARPQEPPAPKRSLRDSYPALPDLSEEDFQEAKALWMKALGEDQTK